MCHHLHILWSYEGSFTTEMFVLRFYETYGDSIIFNMQKNIIKLGLLTRLFRDFKLLFPLIKDYWKGTYRDVSVKSIVIFIIALAYIISPIDLIPDYILGFGQIDDAVILGLALNFLEKDLTKYREWKDRKID
jgi:uncharacterized membrane protein YkvA (DUF1232 family)